MLDLLHGHASDIARGRALRHLTECPECEARFRELDRATERMRAGVPSVLARTSVSRLQPWVYSSLAAAALILVVIIPMGRWRHDARLSPITAQLHALPVAGEVRVTRGESTSADAVALARGLEAYDQGDYGSAIRILRTTQSTPAAEQLRRIYLGSALALDGRLGAAEKELAAIPDRAVPEPWNSEVRWTWCMAKWGSGDVAAADSALRFWSQQRGPLAARANRLLRAGTLRTDRRGVE
ncbi:MAG: hypothetical protein ABL977_08520 [Candidatus Eisenbacteria bacterium]